MSMIEPSHRGRDRLTESQQDYLKQIFLLTENSDSVSTQSLAERMGVRPASVTGMVKHLDQRGLVVYRPYHGVRLTSCGRRVALEMLRHHRLLESFLVASLGYSWDEVHAEAERLEHVISERFEARIAEALGHPTHDPHGDPIPDSSLAMPAESSLIALDSLREGASGRLVRVTSQDAEALDWLARAGMVLGASVSVVDRFDEMVRLETDGRHCEVPAAIAAGLWIEEVET